MSGLQAHPFCEYVPVSSEAEYSELLEDIREHGFDPRFPVVIYEGKILDGRHRARACAELGIEPITVEWTPSENDTPARFVLRAQRRRSLTAGQRAALAVELLPELEKESRERMATPPPTKVVGWSKHDRESVVIAAKEAKSNASYVRKAKKLKEDAPDEFEKVKRGEVTIKEASSNVAPKRPQQPKDALGRPITEASVRKALDEAKWFTTTANKIHAIKREVMEMAKLSVGAELAAKQIETALLDAARAISFAMPFTTCPYPSCRTRGCKACDGRRWLTETQWDRVPKSIKEPK